MQETQVYANTIDCIVMNSGSYHFEIPDGVYHGFDLLKRIWFKIQTPKKNDKKDVIMQRNLWLSSAQLIGDEVHNLGEDGIWYDTGMRLVPIERK
jgi:hypothetical protein